MFACVSTTGTWKCSQGNIIKSNHRSKFVCPPWADLQKFHSSHHSIMPAFEASHDTQKIKGGEDNEKRADGGGVKKIGGWEKMMDEWPSWIYIWMMFSKILKKSMIKWDEASNICSISGCLISVCFFCVLSFSYEPSKVGWKLAALEDFPFETPEVSCNISQRQLRSR